jgi:hypothetical protein
MVSIRDVNHLCFEILEEVVRRVANWERPREIVLSLDTDYDMVKRFISLKKSLSDEVFLKLIRLRKCSAIYCKQFYLLAAMMEIVGCGKRRLLGRKAERRVLVTKEKMCSMEPVQTLKTILRKCHLRSSLNIPKSEQLKGKNFLETYLYAVKTKCPINNVVYPAKPEVCFEKFNLNVFPSYSMPDLIIKDPDFTLHTSGLEIGASSGEQHKQQIPVTQVAKRVSLQKSIIEDGSEIGEGDSVFIKKIGKNKKRKEAIKDKKEKTEEKQKTKTEREVCNVPTNDRKVDPSTKLDISYTHESLGSSSAGSIEERADQIVLTNDEKRTDSSNHEHK